jgi:hypothetical protein
MLTYSAYIAPGVFVDRSGKITTGGTSQTAIPANGNRRRLIIQNPATAGSQGIGTAENLFVNFTLGASGTAGSSIELLPGGSYDTDSGPCTTEQINIVAATTNHQYLAKEMT